MSKKIYLSPSQQANNAYAYGNTTEMEQCNKIAESTKTILERCGFDVKKAPKGQSILNIIKESNSWNPDLHVCIHTNAFNGKTLGGTLVMIYSTAPENTKAGVAMLEAVAPISPGKDYTLRANPSLAELNGTKAVAVYVEVEFHDVPAGAKWIVENTEQIAKAIAKGVCKYFDIKYINDTNSVPSSTSSTLYKVQIGAFKNKENADVQLKKAKESGFSDAFIVAEEK